ncbi:MAG TPA: formate dehydrogenase accessory sulfurtransferase FdhD [Candidatus Thermoplasmatota archaeon]|nr:formate dehydrogenase accessory sulfurtransferase FdhD [Candidatus Thermoplasmatota archaeon]
MAEGRVARRVVVVRRRGRRVAEASVPEEAEVRVLHNSRVVATLAASPVALEELAVGHLALQGRVRARADVGRVHVRRWHGAWHVVVEGRAWPPVPPKPRLPRGPALAPAQVRVLMKALVQGAAMYREGGGVHTSALASPQGIVALAADIGKVNTLDRLAGRQLLEGLERAPILLTTGRLTGAVVARALALGCSLLVSHSGPTSRALALAEARGASLLGYARGGGFTIYTGARRVAGRRAPKRAA